MTTDAAGKWSDLLPRLASALAMVAVALAAIWYGGAVFGALLSVSTGIMAWELTRMLAPDDKGAAWQMGAAAALAVGLALALPFAFVAPVLLVPPLMLVARLAGQRRIAASYMLLILCGGFALGLVRNEYGIGVVLWLIVLVVASDVLGYFAGKTFGGPKFWPKVSPKKTWSGTVAGWAGAAAVGAVFGLGSGAFAAVICASILLAFAAQMGDIAESAIKRLNDVKDSSELIPGHGGALDRFDGLISAATVFVLMSGVLGLPNSDATVTSRRRISIFGATGSIGQNTIDLIARAPDDYDVVALSGAGNVDLLARNAVDLGADLAVTAHAENYAALKAALEGFNVEAAAGPEALVDAASRPADWVMSAIVGAAGLLPGLTALERGATLALANKETLVCAGALVLKTADDHGAQLLPVDSEHSAVFQALIGEDMAAVERVIITASGGAFRDWPLEDLPNATLAQASAHPNWDMGQRITIDSASMFNKALELIETREYFRVDPAKIEVIIHPESMIHAMVGFNDGALMAHVGPPDMRHAIGFALHHPARKRLPVERLDLAKLGQFTFRAPCETRWPALRLAREVMERRGLAGAVFNAAKETALDGFIAGKIKFTRMAGVVEEVLSMDQALDGLIDAEMTLDNVLRADHLARKAARGIISDKAGSLAWTS